MRLSMVYGEARLISEEWAQEAERAVATIASSEWEYNGSGALTGESVSGTKASLLFAPTSDGILSNAVTLSDGQVFIHEWEVSVV